MFSHPLGWIALAGVPLVLALHLYRRRFEPRTVSALFLWRLDDHVPLAGRKREPLRRSVSLWCELLAAALLAAVLAGPRSSCAASTGEHLVVVLDSSASMGAVDDGRSARDRAVELVRARIADLARGSRVTLVASGLRPALVAGPAAFPTEAAAALEAWEPLAGSHDLAPAIALALELAGGGRVLLVTDHDLPEAWPEVVESLSVGRPLDNWAITHAARTGERVFVTLASFADRPRPLDVRVSSGGRILAEERRELAALARAHLAFTVPEGTGRIEVRLDPDALALDDVAYLAAPATRTLALASSLEPGELRALGLAGREGGTPTDALARWLALVPDSVAASSPDSAHLVLAHAPADGAAAWSIVLAPLGAERRDLVGPFLADRARPVLEGLTLEGLVWSADPTLVLPGVPLVSAGDLPLLAEERRGGRVSWHLDLDPARSSLQRSPDWPILLLNLAEERRAALPGPERTDLVVGERLVYRPGSELEGSDRSQPLAYVLEGPLDRPESTRREVPALDEVVVEDLQHPGPYTLSYRGRPVAGFALNFTDAAESDLRDARPGHRESGLESRRIEGELSWIELALLLGTLGAALVDWAALARADGRSVG